ncbi:hypothetical protein M3484_20900 [Pseudomonas sp. GX19020]|uniref:hypothetical protein n=1 Tax=Pseudomonas sp. GX19020 TaxID=2942277 RepID=UPI002019D907|nr:hypothetical protein [Pseudomonas sp. GX19020]MCL4069020.1 hypothetical protein [Pseudomonas sp. GX19020]
MDLNNLSREELHRLQGELRTLQSELGTVATAAEVLAEGDFEPEISLGTEGTIIRTRPVAGLNCDLLLIDQDKGADVEIEPEAVLPVAAEVFSAPAPLAKAQPNASAAPLPPVTLRIGSLDDAERREILRLHGLGESNSLIAMKLSRRVQTVGLFLESIKRKAAKAPQETKQPGQPAPSEGQGAQDPGEAATDEVAPAPSALVAGGADIEILGGDQGGLQRDRLAEHDPVQAEGGGRLGSASLPSAEAPPGLNELGRQIWVFLSRLSFPRGWDIELDLDMIEAFGRGEKSPEIALDLGVDTKAVVDRHRQLTAMIRDDRGQIQIDGMATFVRVLREFVKFKRKGGAG